MEQLKEVGVVAEGQNVLLEARIEPKNDSNLRVEWELNGKPVKPGINSFKKTLFQITNTQKFQVLFMKLKL